MKPYWLTPLAEDDLFAIWSYIATDNLAAADQIEDEICDACLRLSARPDLGHYRRDLTDKPVRFLAVRGTYLIVYDPETKPLEVIRILHGARDATKELNR
jgi:plasmid stabilization system protein ParE